jgi:mannose-1-phosphate guanylyltransferase
MVTFGVVPTFPHTGYGYIKAAEDCGPGYRVSEFREKPDFETAQKTWKRAASGTADCSSLRPGSF